MSTDSPAAGAATGSVPVRGWRAVFPPARWVQEYRAGWLPHDAIAGVTLAAYGIPVALAYASLAALTALVTAGMCLIAWALRLSSLVNFISETILLGFKAGAALTIGTTQLPKLFGVKGGGEGFFERLGVLWGQLPSTNLAVLGFGVAAIVVLLLGERLLPGKPVALGVVALSIVLLSFTSLGALGFKVVGALPPGLPHFQAPGMRPRDVDGLLPLAFACLL